MEPRVVVVMGSHSDWATLENGVKVLDELGVPHEARVLSAHRTPEALRAYIQAAEGRGVEVIIAAAGGAAHLAGVCASLTWIPVLGVPMESAHLHGMDSLLSTVQMPGGVPVGTLGIGKPGAINAALLATAILARKYPEYRAALDQYRSKRRQELLDHPDPRSR
ncbi:MAG TPA: 5-(carboxyamino)imidazole ribonucleotide mutase [Thermoplasmata archaeon]|nr:5-(carboxyamino)imidazole ribonucleotide mutase [Thermoplasmata archaeon]